MVPTMARHGSDHVFQSWNPVLAQQSAGELGLAFVPPHARGPVLDGGGAAALGGTGTNSGPAPDGCGARLRPLADAAEIWGLP